MVDNAEKWGRKTARERYGKADNAGGLIPPDQNNPQMPMDKHGPDYDNSTPSTWLRGMPNESAEGKPDFKRSQGYK